MLRICFKASWTKLYFYFCVLFCFLKVYIQVFLYNCSFLCVVIYMFVFVENADVGKIIE